jgi:P4 family phage/plasmid primase-like protien
LTEKQLQNDQSQILVDFDFRYEKDVEERKHSIEHIEDIIQLYAEKIHKYLNIEQDVSFPVYVMEKPNVNSVSSDKYNKDGIHMVFNISADHTLQCMIRNDVLREISDVLDDLELSNDYESVLDDGISKGHTNWQMYGSRKPGNEAYEITSIYNVEIDENGEPTLEIVDVDDINKIDLMMKVSARNTSCPKFSVRDDFKEMYDQYKLSGTRTKKSRANIKMKFTQEGFNFDVSEIKDADMLNSIIEKMFSEFTPEEYHLKEAHNYLMCLPNKFYDGFNEWIRCGWALHNTDFRLFLSWMLFSSQSEKFNFSDIPGYYDEWLNMSDDGYTNWSIMYWARESNPEGYKLVQNDTIDHYLNLCINGGTEWDIANVLYHYYKDEYRCASVKHKTWYRFKNNRWVEEDNGSSLRYNISRTLSRIFTNKVAYYLAKAESTNDAEESDKIREVSQQLTNIATQLKKTNFKKNIMTEAADAFSRADPDFLKKLDENPNLLCFKNGVIDLKEKIFRPGRAEDRISMTTHIKYIPSDKFNKKQLEYVEEIKEFMKKLFPVPELNRYMWEHLASVLFGKNINQTFNIYNGGGSNGKSKLVDLMSLALGDYKGVCPVSLLTERRGGVGSLSGEVAALKGIRYAVAQEPSKGAKLNDGMMKEMTGEDTMMANPKYKDPIEFVPQFSLVVCTNTLFEIKSSDDGTWRRIRLCEFLSKFKYDACPSEEEPYQYEIDPTIGEKFEEWKEVFMSMLIDIAFQTEGKATDCEMVLAASNEYRKGQDYLMEFKVDKIEKSDDPESRIKKTEVFAEFKIWYQETYGKSVPKGKELYDFLDKKLGKSKRGGWQGYKIR